MGNTGNKTKYLLDIFVKIRTVKALDKTVSRNSAYHDTLKRQDKTFDKLDMTGLSKEQSAIVDKAISAAYRLGLQDGIKLASEVKAFE